MTDSLECPGDVFQTFSAVITHWNCCRFSIFNTWLHLAHPEDGWMDGNLVDHWNFLREFQVYVYNTLS